MATLKAINVDTSSVDSIPNNLLFNYISIIFLFLVYIIFLLRFNLFISRHNFFISNNINS